MKIGTAATHGGDATDGAPRLWRGARLTVERLVQTARATRSPPTGRVGARATLVGALTATFLLLFARYPRLTTDSILAAVEARDCLDGHYCPSRGAGSSFRGIYHGGLWVRILANMLGLGLGAEGPHLFIVLLTAVAASLAYVWVWRHWSPRLALQASGWYVFVTFWSTTLPRTEPQDLTPLPALVLFICLVRLAATGAVRWSVACGVALYFLTEAHVSGAMMIPVVVATIIACCRRPVVGLTLAAGVGLAAAGVTSSDALASNLARVRYDWLWLTASGGLIVAMEAGVVGRYVLARAGRGRRVGWTVASLLGLALIAQVALGAYGHRAGLDYLPVAALPISLGLTIVVFLWTASLGRRPGRWSRAASVLLTTAPAIVLAGMVVLHTCWLAIFVSPKVPMYSVHDSQELSAAFGRLGWSYADTVRYLRGPFSFDLASTGVLWAPWNAPVRHGLDDLRVLKAPRSSATDAAKSGWTVTDLGDGAVGLLSPLHSWLRQDDMRYCVGRPGDDIHSALCRPFSDDVWSHLERPTTFVERMDDLALPMRKWWPTPPPPPGTSSQEWLEIPIEIAGDDAFHELVLVDPARWTSAAWPTWWIEGIDGVSSEVSADGQRVTLRSGSRRQGSIRWTRKTVDNTAPWQLGPGYLELRPGEEAIDRLLGPGSALARRFCGPGLQWPCP